MRDVGKLRELAADLRKKTEHLSGHALHIVLAAGDDEGRGLVLQQVPVGDGLLVLDAVHALDHLVIQAARCAPADRGGDQQHVGPVHEGFVDAVELVFGIHLRDRARPGAGAGAFRVKTFAGTEAEVIQADQLRLAAQRGLGVGDGDLEQRIGGAVARMVGGHHRGGDAGDADRPRRTHRFARERMRRVGFAPAFCRRRGVDQHAAALDPDLVHGHPVFLEAGLAYTGAAMEFPVVPGADYVVAFEAALAERAADVVAGTRYRAETAVLVHQRDAGFSQHHLLQGFLLQLGGAADVDPVGLVHDGIMHAVLRGTDRKRRDPQATPRASHRSRDGRSGRRQKTASPRPEQKPARARS